MTKPLPRFRRPRHRLLAGRLLLGVLSVCFVGLAAPVTASPRLDVTYELALRSPHVWRGITLRQFSVFNASATARHDSGLALQLWVGIDLGDGNGRQGEVQEIDIDLSRTWQSPRQTFTLGYVELIFPGGIDNTGELYAKWRGRGALVPSLEVFYNVDLLRDVFVQLSLRRRWELAEGKALSATFTAAYAGIEYAKFFGGSEAGPHHWGVNLDFDLGPRRSGLTFRLAYSESLDEAVLPEQPSRLWGGIYWNLPRP